MHLVRKDLGAAVANEIARELVVAPHRHGGQAQYIAQSLPEPTATTLARTRPWAISTRPPSGVDWVAPPTFARGFGALGTPTAYRWAFRRSPL